MDSAPTAAVTPDSHTMADEAESSTAADTDACASALMVFVTNGRALLQLAEKESRQDSRENESKHAPSDALASFTPYYAGPLAEFVRRSIRIERERSLLGLIQCGAQLYKSLCVKRINHAQEIWKRNTHCLALQDALQQFEHLEVQWDAFLQDLDDALQLGANVLNVLQTKCVSPETALISATTGRTVTLEKHLYKGKKVLLVLVRQLSCLLCRLHIKDLQKNQRSLEQHSVETLVISFGCQEGASHWLRETSCPYEMLLDPDRKLYTALGLGASVRKVLNFRNMLLYAEYVMDNKEFPRGFPSVQEDMFQLGGDFLLDEHGRMLFSHRCQSPIDRPSVQDILSALPAIVD